MYALDNPGAVRRTNQRGEEYALYFSAEASDANAAPREVHVEEEKIAPPDERSEVYEDLLSRLSLTLEHRENLISRGLGEEWIERAKYRSMPSRIESAAIDDMRKHFGRNVLLAVPGFIEQNAKIIFSSPTGIIVPARDTKRRIIALKIRRDEATRSSDRYRWITSRTDDYDGPSPGSPCHVPLWTGGSTREVRVTEGELKADVATFISGILTISIPGATAVRSCVESLADLGPKTVRLAWDADKGRIPEEAPEGQPRRRNFVAVGLQRAALMLSQKGYKISVEHWPIAQGKGIDDMLSQRRDSYIGVYEGERAWRVIEQTMKRVGETPSPEVTQKANPRLAEDPEFVPPDHAEEVFPELPPNNQWMEDLPRRENGGIICRLSSLAMILRNDQNWAGRLAFDEMSRMPLLDGREIEEPVGMLPIREQVETQWDMTVGAQQLTESVLLVAHEHKFHPVRRYLSGLRWDGKPRIDRIVKEILRIDNEQPLDSIYVRMMLIASVRRIMTPGTKVDTTFVLQGPQGAKKSTFFRLLSHPWFSDTHMEITDRDGKMQLAAAWIYEWGEIEKITTLKHGAYVKSFLSSSEDTVRLPYARSVSRIPRHTIIVGTTNEEQFLTDNTGDRRYWVVKVTNPIDADKLRQWRDQIWAEAMTVAAQGESAEPHFLNAEQESTRAKANEQFRTSEMWEDVVVKWLAEQKTLCGLYTLDEIFKYALNIEAKDVSGSDERRMAKILRSLGFTGTTDKVTFFRSAKRLRLRGWLTPPHGPWVNDLNPRPVLRPDDPHSPTPTALNLTSSTNRWS